MSSEQAGVRRRKRSKSDKSSVRFEHGEPPGRDEDGAKLQPESVNLAGRGQYWITRIVLLRFLAFMYLVAFLCAFNDNRHLLGKNGLTPVHKLIDKYRAHYGVKSLTLDNAHILVKLPSLMWLSSKDNQDLFLDGMSFIGIILSSVILATGATNAVALFILWLLYTSIVNVGQTWYSFGWESQLLESGFLAMFCFPVTAWEQMPLNVPTPAILIWGYRWLQFRIMIGAGLIKIRGDSCWRDLTCMNYHYETQPNPNPASWFLHHSPESIHKMEVAGNHIVELVLPWFTFLPRPFRMINGVGQVLFQVILIISGNLSFLNWLTILPALAYFDDEAYSMFVSRAFFERARDRYKSQIRGLVKEKMVRRTTYISLTLLIGYLSIPVVQNLLSPRQAMNTSFEPLRLVNSYGAFGSITKERTEIIVQGTHSRNAQASESAWKEYEFKCKPGNVTRMPCLISPYHYRLDWLMWFAAFQDLRHNPWLLTFAYRLLHNNPGMDKLIAVNPFQGGLPPRYIRMLHYRYHYTSWGSREANEGKWWTRTLIRQYMPPVNIDMLKNAPGIE